MFCMVVLPVPLLKNQAIKQAFIGSMREILFRRNFSPSNGGRNRAVAIVEV